MVGRQAESPSDSTNVLLGEKPYDVFVVCEDDDFSEGFEEVVQGIESEYDAEGLQIHGPGVLEVAFGEVRVTELLDDSLGCVGAIFRRA
jgi:hypothetical protein